MGRNIGAGTASDMQCWQSMSHRYRSRVLYSIDRMVLTTTVYIYNIYYIYIYNMSHFCETVPPSLCDWALNTKLCRTGKFLYWSVNSIVWGRRGD